MDLFWPTTTLWILVYLHVPRAAGANCNKTWRSEKYEDTDVNPIVESMTVPRRDIGSSVTCTMKFEGRPNEVVQVKVKSVRTGSFNKITGNCEGGHLKIMDGRKQSGGLPPTTLCGYYDKDGPTSGRILVKRFTSQSFAKVEFAVDRANASSGFDIEVIFFNKNNKHGLKQGYGSYAETKGRVPGTICDWTIPVHECNNECYFVSPGYPGIYPPNTRCRYYLNNKSGKRVELYMSSKFRVKFDMKKSDDCSPDYVMVYEGNTTNHPLIGKFCGHDGKVMISKFESLVVEFNSGSGGPKWDYSGFEANLLSRWGDEDSGGKRVPGTVCDYVFNKSKSGELNTADHQLPRGTTCNYIFRGNPAEQLSLQLVVKKMSKACEDYIEIDLENSADPQRICYEDLKSKKGRNEYKFRSDGPNATIRYVHNGGQISNTEPIFIDYEFLTDKNNTVKKSEKPGEPKGSTSGAVRELINLGLMMSIIIFNLVNY